MVLDSNKTRKNLLKKKFAKSPHHSNDHRYLEYDLGDGTVLLTKISHGGKFDIPASVIQAMAEQCELDKTQFFALATCTMSKEEYRQILIDKGVLIPKKEQESKIKNKISRVLLGAVGFFKSLIVMFS